MKSFLAIVSSLIQLIYVLSLLGFITSMINLGLILSLYGTGDPKMMAGGLSSALIELLLGATIGLVGVALAWWVLRDRQNRPAWFLPVSTFFAWAWIVFLPIGTVIGVVMLRWRRADTAENSTPSSA